MIPSCIEAAERDESRVHVWCVQNVTEGDLAGFPLVWSVYHHISDTIGLEGLGIRSADVLWRDVVVVDKLIAIG